MTNREKTNREKFDEAYDLLEAYLEDEDATCDYITGALFLLDEVLTKEDDE